MANTVIQDLSESSTQVDGASNVLAEANVEASSSSGGHDVGAVERPNGHNAEASPLSLSPDSASTPLGGSSANGLHLGANNPPTLTVPHPKKFSHVNINKKFLEKASSTSPSGQTTSTSTTTKTGSTSQKPVLQTAPSHSRLVTTKLTATPQPSATTGAGWSRPSSTVSSVAPTPTSATNPKTPALPTSAPSHAAPQPAPVGKVIQPQPRSVADASGGTIKKSSSSKSVWGNAKVAPTVAQLDSVAADFPTAAEVAQGWTTKSDKKPATESAEAHKQALTAEEDTFRGVHLDPNAHHWDEMEEDDDNFLGGVIEFDDGRQYKIQPSDVQHQSPPRDVPELGIEADYTKQSETFPPVEQPVSKEERFADDFDRSWPQSRITTTFPQQQRDHFQNGPASATSSQSLQSPQESSRVLFNERSNRLEPYSHAPHRQGGPGPPSYFMRRGSRSDHTSSPTDGRFTRDLPPHTYAQGVRLLQKDGRAFGEHLGHPSSEHRERDVPRRDSTFPPYPMMRTTSPGRRDHYSSFSHSSISPRNVANELPVEGRTRRSATQGPPSPSAEMLTDGHRQLPPHLADLRHPPRPSVPVVSLSETTTSITPSSEAPPGREPSSLPPAAHSPAKVLSPVPPMAPEKNLQSSAMPLVDIDEVRKAAMHSAAERAKLRRQQEEEEREKEKERARRKAAELEVKIKATEQAKEQSRPDAHVPESQVVQDAVESAHTVTSVAEQAMFTFHRGRSPLSGRQPLSKGASGSRRTSFHVETHLSERDGESWRSKPAVRSPPTHLNISLTQHGSLPPAPLLAEVDSLNVKADENLEVFDFSELGKLVGAEGSPQRSDRQEVQSSGFPPRPPRAVASDFFDDHTPASHASSTSNGSDASSWRRTAPHVHSQPEETTGATPVACVSENPEASAAVQEPSKYGEDSSAGWQGAAASHHRFNEEASRLHPSSNNSTLSSHTSQWSPLTPTYREAPMSALNDAILRVKGALDGMHTKPEPPRRQKWLPPALRPRVGALEHGMSAPTEVFDRTGYDPPRSPKPAWNNFVVKLPHLSVPLEPVSERQLRLSKSHLLMQRDIFSWRIPAESLFRRDITEGLFGRPQFYRGHARYYVLLPRMQHVGLKPILEETCGPVVNLPSKPTRSSVQKPSSSSSRDLDDIQNHVNPMSSKFQQTGSSAHRELDTTSRSPPPEASSGTTASLPRSDGATSQAVNGLNVKSRIQPKMPAGSDVAFYRDARVEAVSQPATAVNFIVTSELETEFGGVQSRCGISSSQTPTAAPSASLPADSSDLSTQRQATDSLVPLEHETRQPQSPVKVSITSPPQASSSWMKSPRVFPSKDSPARAPDPEHLKAVWLQASDKAALPSVNSLEGIADDLTAVPFTLQDVKSEDGETPPPSGSGPPSRMSLHDVTRAFQQVPAPSVNPARGAALPPIASPTNGATSRQPQSFAFTPSVPSSNMRSPYSPYPSPMMASPSPAVLYPQMAPSPAPRPMMINGTPPAYVQPMWMPVPPPNGQAPGAMMRPLTSPYPAQLLPYSPGGALPVYAPPPQNMPNGSPQQVNGMQNRLTMMSPVMQQAPPIYAGSPALMSALPPGAYPGGVPANRPQLRGVFDASGVPMMPSSVTLPPPQPPTPYAPVPPTGYARSTW